ncbi:sensor histidine kinase [Marinifilum sp. RC60d5]|uniref:sensor histidine kinase n=1 Tax=Marinifilum sp. RC60d5 TaxID=3458414 RepID=UPI004036D13F
MHKLKSNFPLLLFCLLLTLTSYFSSSAKDIVTKEYDVLILQSYHQGLEWTDSISSGILNVMNQNHHINLVFEYLDIKRNDNDAYQLALQNIYKTKAKDIPFKAIIVADNAAFDFMCKHGNQFYPNIPVIYCGVNNLNPEILHKYPNFHGFGEKADHYGTLSSIKKIFPQRKNILIINDNTITGKAITNELRKVLPFFKNELNFEVFSDFSIESLQEKVSKLSDSCAIYLLVLNRDKNNKFISYRNGINTIKKVSNVPIFGSWDFYLNKGIFGGKITSGYQQGKNAALLALKIIESGSQSIPQYTELENTYIFDHNEMINFDIKAAQLPKGSQTINQPETSDFLLKISLACVIILIVIIFTLLIWLKSKQKRAEHLKVLVSEKTSELNKTNSELQQAITDKNKFFSILAHDLRGSIGVILGISGLLNDEDFKLNPPEGENLEKDLLHVATQTNALLDDLFYWGINQSKEGPTIEISQFDVNEIILDTCKTFQINLGNINFETKLQENLVLNTDKNICKFIIRNIVQNAMKFSHKNGSVIISSYSKNNCVYVEIKDNGIGMPPHVVESIYKKSPIRKEGLSGQRTTGLGLCTVLDYLEIINGEMQINSQIDAGSTFTVIFKEN